MPSLTPRSFRQWGPAGILGVSLPEEFGCADAGYAADGLVARDIEQAVPATARRMPAQSSLAMFPIHVYDPDEQCRRYLSRLACGELIGCFGLTRPDAAPIRAACG